MGNRFFNSYNKKLFLNFFIVFVLFATAVIFYQYKREKQVKVNNLEAVLNNYNKLVYNKLQEDSGSVKGIAPLVKLFPDHNLRVSLIDLNGVVFYDSFVEEYGEMENHLDRPEIVESNKKSGKGSRIRYSKSTAKDYYYFAAKYDYCFVRTALPYNLELVELLKVEAIYFTVILIIFLIAIFFLIFVSDRLGHSISTLEKFAISAGNNDPINTKIQFPNNQLGAIGDQIVAIYQNLRRTREDLSNEKEKLFNHLLISQEGLAIFSHHKREILANETFIQFANFIADQKIVWSDEIFKLEEFKSVRKFVDVEFERRDSQDEHGLVEMEKNISKNGRFFTLRCVIFQDLSFEVSINDTTNVEKQNILKRELTSNIAHELRTPVSSISGYMETLVNNPDLDKTKSKFFIERSYSQAKRLSGLISDIALVNKMEEASSTFAREEIFIEDIVEEVLNDVHLILAEKKIRTIVNFDMEVMVYGNRTLLYSIFRNLIDNSLSYAGKSIDIGISCYREDDQYFYFSYYDSGVGISEEHLIRIFERFYRVDSGRSRKMGGTGLGLAIVKNAVNMHGGQINVKNRKEGGLEFLFTFRKQQEVQTEELSQ